MKQGKVLYFVVATSLLLSACDQAESNASESGNDTDAAQEQPSQISAWIDEKKRECVSDGFEFDRVDNFLRTADFNADGKTDYILWDGGVVCEGRPASWFGNAGPPLTFLISNGDDHEFFEGFGAADLDELELQSKNGKDVIKIGGRQGNKYLEVTWSWNGWEISPNEKSWAIGPTLDSSDYQWSLEEDGGVLYAGYGSTEAGFEYVLECEKGKPTISLSNGEAGLYESDFVEMDVEGQSTFVGKTTITQDTEYFTATVAIPTSSGIYTDLIAGKSPLRIKWNKATIDELTNGPKLQEFLTKCRERARS